MLFLCCRGLSYAGSDLIALEEQAMKQAVDKAAPAVVRIETLGGLETVEDLLIGTGPTTGLIVSADGHIVSSAFNFIQQPASILVTLPGGERLPAKLVARDHSRMLVLLKVEAKAELPVPEAAPLDGLAVGQWAIALGRTFEADKVNRSVGVISALNRVWGKAIQTDAKVSPNNYGGPLVDIHGRVLGMLVPLSPQETGEVAGVEWYDSGIGFAIPLEHIQRALPKLQEGADLHAGLLGVSIKSNDLYATPAVIAACHPKSPAYEAGLKAGDAIIEIDGRKVAHQADLRHVIAGRYAGDAVRVVAMRGEQRIEREIKLVAKLPAYEHPFLGILPMRDGSDLAVRFVYENSPASKAEIQPGDKVASLAGQPIASIRDAIAALATLAPGETVAVEIRRGEKSLKLDVQLGVLPTLIPAELPPSPKSSAPAPAGKFTVGSFHLKVPELPNDALVYVPPDYNPDASYGIVVSLHGPGGFRDQELIDIWQRHCQERGLILLAPKAADPLKWQRTEREFIRKALDKVMSEYKVDPSRVVLVGQETGGAMAYLVAFAERDVIRGVAVVGASIPASLDPPANDPLHRLAVLVASSKDSSAATQLKTDVQRLRAARHPVSLIELGPQQRRLDATQLDELARWVDSLDRL